MTREELKARSARIAWTVSQGHKSAVDIAKDFGVCRATVSNCCREHGVSTAMFQAEQRAERDRQILKAAADGVVAAEIASRFGFRTVSPVYTICKRAAQPVRRPPPPLGKGSVKVLRTVNIVCDLLAGDGNQNGIAERHKVTRQWISLVAIELRKRGLLPSESS